MTYTVLHNHLHLVLRSRPDVDVAWCDVMSTFGQMFKGAVGTPESRAQEAIRNGQQWPCAREIR